MGLPLKGFCCRFKKPRVNTHVPDQVSNGNRIVAFTRGNWLGFGSHPPDPAKTKRGVPVFAVGRGRQEHQPSLPPSINVYLVSLNSLLVTGAAAPWFKVWCWATQLFPPAHRGAAKEEGGEKGSLLAESCMDGCTGVRGWSG